MKKTKKIRKLMQDNDIHIAPGVFDGLTARLVEQTGFNLVYASGGAIARSCGFPDIGLLSFSEVLQRLEHIVEVTGLPVIADADTGFGNAINVSRTVKLFEKIGLAALHLEDQTFPKRCGHLDNKSLITKDEMILKIKTAKASQTDQDFVIIARTDAIAVEGFGAAIDRAKAYLQSGADMIFIEAPETIKQIEEIADLIPQPKLINMFHSGKTPLVSRERLHELGYKFVIIPSDLQRAAIHACQETLTTILEHGNSSSMTNKMVSFQDREKIIKTSDYINLVT